MVQMHFKVDGNDKAFDIQRLVIAGWTGRNHEAVEHHIKELEAIGVKRPRTVPCFYRLSANLLTSDNGLEMVGTDSSGEAEFVLISAPDGLYVGVGSDHTDRKVEAYGVTVSRCASWCTDGSTHVQTEIIDLLRLLRLGISTPGRDWMSVLGLIFPLQCSACRAHEYYPHRGQSLWCSRSCLRPWRCGRVSCAATNSGVSKPS